MSSSPSPAHSGVPLGWWFTPPPDGTLHTPDHQRTGLDFAALVDIVLGTADTLPPWTEALEHWAAQRAKTGRAKAPMVGTSARAGEQLEVRARTLVREQFGDIDEASDVLRRLADLLDQLDESDKHGTAAPDAGVSATGENVASGSASELGDEGVERGDRDPG